MYHFFVPIEQIGSDTAYITGTDVNHIANVLRMRIGEEIEILDGKGGAYTCSIESFASDRIGLKITDTHMATSELPVKITLFQGYAKADKMEHIVQKSVELGVHEIVPVMTERSIVKLNDAKAGKKVDRLNGIALSAAKQSGRGIIPVVKNVMSFKEAVKYASELDTLLIPYEHADDMDRTREIMGNIKSGSVGVFIGPEGGFACDEVELARKAGASEITLGKRILRTETAGPAVLAMLMFLLEE